MSVQATCEPVEGGRYRIVMHGPDGDDHITIGGVFKELVPARRLVMTGCWERVLGQAEPDVSAE